MAHSLFRKATHGGLDRVVSFIVALAIFAFSSTARARDDVLVTLDASTAFILLRIDGFDANMGLVRGTVSIETEDANCVASLDHPCSYIVNFVRLKISTFVLPTSNGDYTVADPFSVIQGPIHVVDSGFGIVIPQGEHSEGGANCSGPDIDSGFRSSVQGLPTPLSINIDIPSQTISLEGEFRTSLEGHTGVGTIISSGELPFLNLPPVADAGPDLNIVCPQDVTLDACGSTDPNDSLQLFSWLSGGANLATIPAAIGCSTQVPFDAGTFDITLHAFDTFGGRGHDELVINVTDPPPDFTFVPGPLTTTSCGALNIGQAQATSPCGPVTITNNAPASFGLGVTTVTWTATSVNNQVSTAKQRVEVILGDNAACCPAGFNVIAGTSNNDNLNGTPGNDCILGKGAQDTINGGGGNDLISGGDGDDFIDAGSGNDSVWAGSGQDQVLGGSGTDSLSGGDGNDVCRGGIGNDQLRGGQGQDQLFGDDNNDVLLGDDGDDQLNGGSGDDHLAGGGLHDTCTGGSGSNTFTSCENRPDAPSAPDSCTDGLLNGIESAIDCGGLACLACGSGLNCASGADCSSNICSAQGSCQSLPQGSSPLQASLSFTTDWGAGYCATLNVTNPSASAVGNWSVLIDTNQSTTANTWNGTFSATSGSVSISPAFEWNQSIDAAETDSSIGFCANRTVPNSTTLPFVVSTSGS